MLQRTPGPIIKRHEALLLSKRRRVKSHKREIRAGQLIAVKATTIVRRLLFFVCFFGVSTHHALCVCVRSECDDLAVRPRTIRLASSHTFVTGSCPLSLAAHTESIVVEH